MIRFLTGTERQIRGWGRRGEGDGQNERAKGREGDRQTDKQTERERERLGVCARERQTDRQSDRQIWCVCNEPMDLIYNPAEYRQ